MTLLPVIIIVRISRSGSTSHRRIDGPTVEFVTGSGGRGASNRRSHKTRIADELLYICDSERMSPRMSNGRINRRRAHTTRPENNKIYILICAGTSSRPTSKESRREIGGGKGERDERDGGMKDERGKWPFVMLRRYNAGNEIYKKYFIYRIQAVYSSI